MVITRTTSGVDLGTTTIHFAGSTSPGGASAANDGNEDTSFTLNDSNTTVTFTSHGTLDGTFVEQRYFAVLSDSVSSGNIRLTSGIHQLPHHQRSLLQGGVPLRSRYGRKLQQRLECDPE